MNASISLCIPAFNASRFLPALFESISKQEIPFNEILLYNDCSTDDTAKIAKSFGAKIINGEKNSGCSFGKNQLATHVTSEWIFFLDADDILYPDFTKVVHQFIAKNPFSEMIIVGYNYVDLHTGNQISQTILSNPELEADPIKFMINHKVVNSSVIKTQAFNKMQGFGLDENLLFIEDRAFSIKAAIKGVKIKICQEVIFQINYFSESMSGKDPSKWISASNYLFEKINKETDQQYKNEISNQLFQNAAWAGKFNLWGLVKKSIALALSINPHSLPAGSKLFRLLFRLSPYYAFIIRTKLMRKIKPQFNE